MDAETGDEQWRFQGNNIAETQPAVVDGTAYIGSDDRNLYAVDAETGEEQWRFEAGGRMVSPAVADSMVYVVSQDGKLYALSGDQERSTLTPTPTPTPEAEEAVSADDRGPGLGVLSAIACLGSAGLLLRQHLNDDDN